MNGKIYLIEYTVIVAIMMVFNRSASLEPVSLIGEYAHRFSDCPHTNWL